jgi:hypothetical protein
VINLPYSGGSQFDEHDLVDYIRAFAPTRDYIIRGAQTVSLANHTKHFSLDYWLRKRCPRQDTMQAVDRVIDDLVNTGLFVRDDNLLCPESHERCKGLRLTS